MSRTAFAPLNCARRCGALLAAAAVLALPALPVGASTSTFGDRTSFLVATTSANATGALPAVGGPYIGAMTFGTVTLQAPRWFVVDMSTLLPGREIAISDGAGDVGGVYNDGLDAAFATPVYAAGFDFHEPTLQGVTDGCNVDPCVDSVFEVRLWAGATPVATLPWLPPDDSASFFGVWSSVAFDRMQIRETFGTDDNEFYGHFYTGFTAPVPEPAPWALLVLGLVAGRGMQRRTSDAWALNPGALARGRVRP